MKCWNCEALREEIEELKKRNAELANALTAKVSGPSNTDLIMGAVLSGGDPLALAKDLVENQKKKKA